jgi:type II secretory pathway component PulM
MILAAHEHGVPFVTAAGVALLGLVMAIRRPLSARREADSEALQEAREQHSVLPEEPWVP